MIGTANCTYKTPCGWCTKWDKKCDMKIPEPPVINQYDYEVNKMCQSEEDHQWECCGISTAGTDYRCKICGVHKMVPVKKQDNATISTHFNEGSIPCFECACVANYSPWCIDCNAENGFKYFSKEGIE